MGVFVRVEAGDDARGSMPPALRFLGTAVVDEMRAVANYELLDAMREPNDYHCIARLEQYPRWSEPGLALFARLIERSEPDFLDDWFDELPLRITLTLDDLRSELAIWLSARGPGAVLVCDLKRDVVQLRQIMPEGLPPSISLQVLGWWGNFKRRFLNRGHRIHRIGGLRAHHALDDARVNRLLLTR